MLIIKFILKISLAFGCSLLFASELISLPFAGQIYFMDNEIWAPVSGHEKYYQISNMGRFKSLPRMVIRFRSDIKKDFSYYSKEKISIGSANAHGYLYVKISSDKIKNYSHRVHRLVAAAFVPNPNNLKEVNHIDGNKRNNKAENLEWVTRSQNIKHAFDVCGKSWGRYNSFGESNPKSKKVDQLSLSGEYIQTFNSQCEASRITGIDQSMIWHCCVGSRKTAKGFRWRYSDGFGRGRVGANNTNRGFKF